jgi:hypothetical protein
MNIFLLSLNGRNWYLTFNKAIADDRSKGFFKVRKISLAEAIAIQRGPDPAFVLK